MYSSQRLIAAIGELSDDKIEKAGAVLRYRGAQRTSASLLISRWLGIAAAAMMVLAISVAAYPIWIHWSRGMEQQLSVTEEEKEFAKSSGLSESVLYNSFSEKNEQMDVAAAAGSGQTESMKSDSAEVVISTVNGVTISVEQTIIDSNTARIALRIEGFALPEGTYPDIGGWQLTFGGERVSNMTGGFAESRDAADNLTFMDADGSLEFDFYASGMAEGFSFEGKEIRLIIDSLGTGNKGKYEPLVEGPWEIRWTPSSSQERRRLQTALPVGDTGIQLLSAEIAAVSAKVTLRLPERWEGYKTLESYNLQLVGLRLKDGTQLINIFGPPGQEGYADIDNLILELDYTSHKIIHPEQVDALLFAENHPWVESLSEEDLIVVSFE